MTRATTYRDRRRPGTVLVKWQITQSFGTLEDTTQRNHTYLYVVDTDGFVFRRYIYPDGGPTRWQKLISASRPMNPADVLARAERSMDGSKRLIAKGHQLQIIEDHRARYGHPAQ